MSPHEKYFYLNIKLDFLIRILKDISWIARTDRPFQRDDLPVPVPDELTLNVKPDVLPGVSNTVSQ